MAVMPTWAGRSGSWETGYLYEAQPICLSGPRRQNQREKQWWKSAVCLLRVLSSFPAFIPPLSSPAFSQEQPCCISLHFPQMGFQIKMVRRQSWLEAAFVGHHWVLSQGHRQVCPQSSASSLTWITNSAHFWIIALLGTQWNIKTSLSKISTFVINP